jgi:Zn-dependent M16 (insulinase) family peptidase
LELGTETQDEVKLLQRIGRETGGIYPAPFTASVHGSTEASAWLLLRGKATTSQAGSLLAILRDALLTARLDNRERFRQIVLEEKAGLEAQLAPMGHRIVNGRLRAKFGESGWAAEQLGGVEFLFFLRRLVDQIEADWPAVMEKLESLRSILLQRGAVICNVTLDGEGWSRFRPELSEFLAGLPDGVSGHQPWTLPGQPANEGLEVPAKVNYVGKGANLYELGYRFDGSILVINNYLRNSWLYERVRLQGGAYGVFPVFDHRSSVYTFLLLPGSKPAGHPGDLRDETGQFTQLDEIRLDIERSPGTLSAQLVTWTPTCSRMQSASPPCSAT